MGSQRCLERFEVLHPFDRKVVWLNISLVEDQYKRELGLVQDTRPSAFHFSVPDVEANELPPASVEHIRHESCRSLSSWSVDDVGHNSRKCGGHGIGYNSSRCGPGENLNLPRSVQNHVTGRRSVRGLKEDEATEAEVLHSIRPFLDKGENLVELGCE